MIGRSRRAKKLKVKRTGENSKEREFFTWFVFEEKLARNTRILVEKHQCFGFTQTFLFSSNSLRPSAAKSEDFYFYFSKE
jgi:hypothetical protein